MMLLEGDRAMMKEWKSAMARGNNHLNEKLMAARRF